jgi:hypothetical protein
LRLPGSGRSRYRADWPAAKQSRRRRTSADQCTYGSGWRRCCDGSRPCRAGCNKSLLETPASGRDPRPAAGRFRSAVQRREQLAGSARLVQRKCAGVAAGSHDARTARLARPAQHRAAARWRTTDTDNAVCEREVTELLLSGAFNTRIAAILGVPRAPRKLCHADPQGPRSAVTGRCAPWPFASTRRESPDPRVPRNSTSLPTWSAAATPNSGGGPNLERFDQDG